MKLLKKFINRNNINPQPIIIALLGLGFLSVILAATMIASAQNRSNQPGTGPNDLQATITPAGDDSLLAVVEEIDSDKQMITLFDVNLLMPFYLTYTGGTNIMDKYGQMITMDQIEPGDMVDASCDQDNNKLISMNISTKAWEYDDVKNMTIDSDHQVMKIASTKYKYNNNLFIRNGKDIVTTEDLTEHDVLKVWGYEQTIWSVTVTKGHGIVELEDYGDYLGDSISIGYESMMQIRDHMAVPIREGTYNLTVENGKYSATKSVTVKCNKTTYVSLRGIGPDGLKQGAVTFHITPEGADLYLDGKQTSYTDPVLLGYGSHTAIASLGGYTSYNGTVTVDSKKETINIDLPEDTGDKNTAATETDSGTDTASNNSSGSNTDTGTTDSGSSTAGNTSANTSSDTSGTTSDTSSETSSDGTKYSSGTSDYKLEDGDTADKKHNIYIKAPSGSSVYLDGQYMGTAPCKFDKIIGNHVLTFIRDGYKTASYTVDITNDSKDAYFTFPNLSKKK